MEESWQVLENSLKEQQLENERKLGEAKELQEAKEQVLNALCNDRMVVRDKFLFYKSLSEQLKTIACQLSPAITLLNSFEDLIISVPRLDSTAVPNLGSCPDLYDIVSLLDSWYSRYPDEFLQNSMTFLDIFEFYARKECLLALVESMKFLAAPITWSLDSLPIARRADWHNSISVPMMAWINNHKENFQKVYLRLIDQVYVRIFIGLGISDPLLSTWINENSNFDNIEI